MWREIKLSDEMMRIKNVFFFPQESLLGDMDVNGDGEIDYEVALLYTIVSYLMSTSISLSYIRQSECENVWKVSP